MKGFGHLDAEIGLIAPLSASSAVYNQAKRQRGYNARVAPVGGVAEYQTAGGCGADSAVG
jgi:hypothetical protein